jgi:hypothetical protein
MIQIRSGVPGLVALDKGEGFVKDRNFLSGVCDTAWLPERLRTKTLGITLNHPAVVLLFPESRCRCS